MHPSAFSHDVAELARTKRPTLIWPAILSRTTHTLPSDKCLRTTRRLLLLYVTLSKSHVLYLGHQIDLAPYVSHNHWNSHMYTFRSELLASCNPSLFSSMIQIPVRVT
jgi:hypothetical protein